MCRWKGLRDKIRLIQHLSAATSGAGFIAFLGDVLVLNLAELSKAVILGVVLLTAKLTFQVKSAAWPWDGRSVMRC